MVSWGPACNINHFAPRSAQTDEGNAAWIQEKGGGGYIDYENRVGVPTFYPILGDKFRTGRL